MRDNNLDASSLSGRQPLLARAHCSALGLLLASCWGGGEDPKLSPEPAGIEQPGARAGVPGVGNEAHAADAFVLVVVSDLDSTWGRAFKALGKAYTPLRSSLSAGMTACDPLTRGDSCIATTPDIDLSFQRRLREKLGEASKAPQAYAMAHQAGHHLQRLLGIDAKVRDALVEHPIARHSVQIQLELQADCFAGLWLRASGRRELLAPEDVERALRQASELGKERRLAQRQGNEPEGESFTYAIPRQRGYWFYQGYTRGSFDACDTFAVD